MADAADLNHEHVTPLDLIASEDVLGPDRAVVRAIDPMIDHVIEPDYTTDCHAGCNCPETLCPDNWTLGGSGGAEPPPGTNGKMRIALSLMV